MLIDMTITFDQRRQVIIVLILIIYSEISIAKYLLRNIYSATINVVIVRILIIYMLANVLILLWEFQWWSF